MLYSIQNSGGRVYGIFDMPPTTKSAEGLAHELRADLADILDLNGVHDGIFRIGGAEGILHDRVVIDIEPRHSDEDLRIRRVHEAVSRLAISAAVEPEE